MSRWDSDFDERQARKKVQQEARKKALEDAVSDADIETYTDKSAKDRMSDALAAAKQVEEARVERLRVRRAKARLAKKAKSVYVDEDAPVIHDEELLKLKQTWYDGMALAYPGTPVPRLTLADIGKLKNYAEKLGGTQNAINTIQYALSNWKRISKRSKTLPEFPKFGLIMAMRDLVSEAAIWVQCREALEEEAVYFKENPTAFYLPPELEKRVQEAKKRMAEFGL